MDLLDSQALTIMPLDKLDTRPGLIWEHAIDRQRHCGRSAGSQGIYWWLRRDEILECERA
jgi:hypothetical protein